MNILYNLFIFNAIFGFILCADRGLLLSETSEDDSDTTAEEGCIFLYYCYL